MGLFSGLSATRVTSSSKASTALLGWTPNDINPQDMFEINTHHSVQAIKEPPPGEVTMSDANEAELIAAKVQATAENWERVCKARTKISDADLKIRQATNKVIEHQAENSVKQFNSNAHTMGKVAALQPTIAKTLSLTDHAVNMAQAMTQMVGQQQAKLFS